MLRLSSTRWMVLAAGYANAKVTATWANSKADLSGVGKVKCRPAFGSTAQKTLAVPHRSYSLSRRASLPGSAAEQVTGGPSLVGEGNRVIPWHYPVCGGS